MEMTVSTSRGRRTDAYHLITPANQFAARLPFLPDVVVVKLATPRAGRCRFGWYLLEVQTGAGTTRPIGSDFEHFFYVLDGQVTVGPDTDPHPLPRGGFLFVPSGNTIELRGTSEAPARVIWVKRRYEAFDGVDAPGMVDGDATRLTGAATSVEGLRRLDLLPADDPAYDFNMSILSFESGVRFPKVEVHDEEHGLYMLEGTGIYHLDGHNHEVAVDDFIYMAPYCPQYFYPSGSTPSAYLLYKDTFRDGF